MSIFADTNLYPGVNAHLNDWLQINEGAWQTFHVEHITDLARTIRAKLPPGYIAVAEPSLQIGEIQETKVVRRSRTDPDVQIFQQQTADQALPVPMAAITPTLELDLRFALDDEDTINALGIYQVGEGGIYGRPVTRIELLSPANKSGGSHYLQYTSKKLQSLKSGLRLVEIDYLHLFPPLIRMLPSYKKHDPDAYPYIIMVSDPRPTFERGKVFIYGINILDPLPIIDIPLAGVDSVQVDFGAAYRVTAENSPYLSFAVDYALDPPAFDRYSSGDQASIRAFLTDIRQQHGEKSPE